MKTSLKIHVPPIAERPAANVFITKVRRKLPAVPLPKAWNTKRIPIALKDNITTGFFPTTCASAILQTHTSPFSAEVVRRLRGNNAVTIIGKTNMDEFGMGSHSMNSFWGPVQNIGPFHRHSVGGSSGGSAVAAADDRCVAALGTDTGGSVRLPAAYTGVVGFKPSYGLVSRWGVIPYANSLDTVGILASNVKITRSAFYRINGFDRKDPTSITEASRTRMEAQRKEDIQAEFNRKVRSGEADTSKVKTVFKNQKIGVPLEYNIAELSPGVREAWQNVLQILQDNGATVVPVSLPNTKHALSAYYVLAPAEAASNLSKYDGVRYGTRSDSRDGAGDVLYSNTRGSGFGDEVRRRILLGSYTLSSEAIDNYFIKAQKVRRLVQRDFDRVFAISNPLRPVEQFDLSAMDESIKLDDKLGPPQVDFIVCPTAPTPPPTQCEVYKQDTIDTYMNDVFTVPASLAGLPAISIPFPIPDEHRISGRPNIAGIQIIGQYSDDMRVLVLATELEKLVPVAPTEKPLIKLYDWGVTKQEGSPKPRKTFSSDLSKKWIARLKMDKWKARQRQRRAMEPTLPESLEAETKRIDREFEDAFKTWASLLPPDTENTTASPTENANPEKQLNLAFHDAFNAWEASEPSRESTTFEDAKEDLDSFFDSWDSKKETGQEEDGRENRSQPRGVTRVAKRDLTTE